MRVKITKCRRTVATVVIALSVLLIPGAVANVDGHYEDTYQEETSGDLLVAASAGWEYETYQGDLAGRARGAHSSIGLPAIGHINVCDRAEYCDNIQGTCLIPDTTETLPTFCESRSDLLFLCKYAWADTENSAGMYVRSLLKKDTFTC